MSDLLFEIGTEEMPASYIQPALDQLAASLKALLAERRLEPRSVRTAGTPRRLAVAAEGLPAMQPSIRKEVVGPPARAAFEKDGSPGKAAIGFARAHGVPTESLAVRDTPKGPYVVAVIEQKGANALQVLPEVLRQAALAVSFPKSMRWPLPAQAGQEERALRFARPIRWVVALLDREVVHVEIAGIAAGRVTWGHPFFASEPIELADASWESYREALRRGRVLVDIAERREEVRGQVSAVLARHGARLTDTALLDEVTGLVEWPHALEGAFDEAFLSVPACVVEAAMTEHQRYFPVRNAGGKLLPRFVIVSNRSAEQEATVREGNERVLRARLADARFFWQEDLRRSLEERVPMLEGVVFLGGLGNNLQRARRLEELSARIARMMGLGDAEIGHARRAAHLCKADLLTGLVGEFPSLQGKVGRELAIQAGEEGAVADAIAEHYRPAGAEDEPPASAVGAALALADKLDVMAGCFALGLLPSGSQDPYALRRNALGVLLILEGRDADLKLDELVGAAREALQAQAGELSGRSIQVPIEQVLGFFRDRLYHAALERGHAHDLVRAVLSVGFDRPTPQERLNYNVRGLWRRLEALAECAGRPWWPALVELVDRTYRIQRDLDRPPAVREELFEQEEERRLHALLASHRDEVAQMFDAGRYVEAAERYCAAFAQEVHGFFDRVFVNVDDERVRHNRKSLCAEVYHLFADRFADLYVIASAGSTGAA